MNINDWPNCPTPDCENKVCLWAGTGHCYKCSERAMGKQMMDFIYNATHTNGQLNPEIEGIEND